MGKQQMNRAATYEITPMKFQKINNNQVGNLGNMVKLDSVQMHKRKFKQRDGEKVVDPNKDAYLKGLGDYNIPEPSSHGDRKFGYYMRPHFSPLKVLSGKRTHIQREDDLDVMNFIKNMI